MRLRLSANKHKTTACARTCRMQSSTYHAAALKWSKQRIPSKEKRTPKESTPRTEVGTATVYLFREHPSKKQHTYEKLIENKKPLAKKENLSADYADF